MRELVALIRRYNISIERQEYHAALVCAVLANCHRAAKSRPFTPADFMPSQAKSGGSPQPREALDDLLAFGNALGAEVRVNA